MLSVYLRLGNSRSTEEIILLRLLGNLFFFHQVPVANNQTQPREGGSVSQRYCMYVSVRECMHHKIYHTFVIRSATGGKNIGDCLTEMSVYFNKR